MRCQSTLGFAKSCPCRLRARRYGRPGRGVVGMALIFGVSFPAPGFPRRAKMTLQAPSYPEPMHHMSTEARLRALAERWAAATPAERANYQLYTVALTEALDVPIPQFFVFVSTDTVPDGSIITIASDDPFVLGVLSSRIHVAWALAAGGRRGVGNDPCYSNGVTFGPFPFPNAGADVREVVGDIAERIDLHRMDALARDEKATMTGIYNVIEKVRSGEELSEKERQLHATAACGVLRDLHDELGGAGAEPEGMTRRRACTLHAPRRDRVEEGGPRVARGDPRVRRRPLARRIVRSARCAALLRGASVSLHAWPDAPVQTSRTARKKQYFGSPVAPADSVMVLRPRLTYLS